TGLVPVDIPYTDTFETAQEYAFRNHSVNKWHIGTAVNNGGTSALYISNNDGVANEYTITIEQTSHVYKDFTIPADAEELEVQFDWHSLGDSYSGDGFTVWAVPITFEPQIGTGITTAATRVRLGRTLYEQNRNFVTERLVMDVSAFAGQTMRLVFSWKNNSYSGENPPAAIDNLKLNYSTCIQPTSSQATAVTAESIAVSWSAVEGVTDYELKITTTPTAPAETVAGVTVTGTTHTFENLDSNTTYYIWVRSICSTTNKSLWKGPLQVTTDLVPVDLPYRDGFEGDQQYAIRNDILNQWYIGNAVNYGGQRALYISGDEGVSNVYLNNNKNQVSHVYKDFIIPANAAELGINFDWRCLGEGSGSYPYDYFSVWLVPITYTPAVGVQTTATNSGGVQIGRPFYNQNSHFLNERLIIDGTSYQGQTMRLLFEWKNNTYSEYQPPAAIDNLEVHVITCSEPTNVQIDSVTSTSVTISWTPVEGQTNYEVYHSATNPGLLGDTVTGSVTTTENPYTIEGLDDNTEYFIWVRTICSATNKSSWVRVVGWTGQIPGELTYEDNFEGDNNWSFISNSINKWVVGRAVSNGGVNALYITKDNGLTNTYNGDVTTVAHAYRDLAVPAAAIGGSLTFDWRALGEGSVRYPYDYMRVWLVPASFRPVMGQQITTGADRLQIGGLYFQQEEFTTALESVDLAPFAGQTMRLVFEWINNSYSEYDPPAAIDNVIFKVETCPAVTGLSACGGADRINYGWDSQEGMTRWEIAFSTTDGAEPDPDLIEIVEEPNYSARGLTVNTTYYFYVRNVCGPDDVSMWKKINVRTNSTSILDAEPFCAGPGGIIFPNNHRGNTPEEFPLGNGQIACLGGAPYPVWYFLKIDQDGDLVFDIIQNT
ncbi:fibronectin type III domain-containing protein, partial [Myroides sp. C15-4]|uniref:fibronectin type III domain-containing protein n=1 Tax=Myroides sp. C15-4 TaxID=3400532 RepID=UPI003D2F95FA